MSKFLRVLSALLATASLAACSDSQSRSPRVDIATGQTSTTITRVVLTDGTPCAVIDTAYSAAVGCDWNSREATTGTTPEGSGTTKVTLVVLSNGVRCAVMDTTAKALDCGWGAKHGTPSYEPKGERGIRVDTFQLGGVTCAVMDGVGDKAGTKALSCGSPAETPTVKTTP